VSDGDVEGLNSPFGVLGELVQKRLGAGSLTIVFPGHSYAPLGLFTTLWVVRQTVLRRPEKYENAARIAQITAAMNSHFATNPRPTNTRANSSRIRKRAMIRPSY
jgi:hypothetical protein